MYQPPGQRKSTVVQNLSTRLRINIVKSSITSAGDQSFEVKNCVKIVVWVKVVTQPTQEHELRNDIVVYIKNN